MSPAKQFLVSPCRCLLARSCRSTHHLERERTTGEDQSQVELCLRIAPYLVAYTVVVPTVWEESR